MQIPTEVFAPSVLFAIMDRVDVGIVTADESGRVTFLNRAAREILHRDELTNPGTPNAALDVRSLLGLARDRKSLFSYLERNTGPHTLTLPDDVELELELSVNHSAETKHERATFFFIFRDLTTEKRMEMERRRFEHLAAMGTMVAGFAHEVRNPVASLRSLAESLAEDLAENKLEMPHVDFMLKALERIERLVRTSLLFGTPTTPRRSLHPPAQLLSNALSSLVARSRALGGRIAVEIDPRLPDVFVDDGQIVQVLVILLDNAIDAARTIEGVSARVSVDIVPDSESRSRKSQPPPGPYVRFEVTDTGPGIPEELLGRIFDPFFTTKSSGTGLGLSIAQQLVSDNGGRIEIDSAPGGPTTFAITLPCEQAQVISSLFLRGISK